MNRPIFSLNRPREIAVISFGALADPQLVPVQVRVLVSPNEASGHVAAVGNVPAARNTTAAVKTRTLMSPLKRAVLPSLYSSRKRRGPSDERNLVTISAIAATDATD
jgi:predicted dinucleotide-utilizing enzyme